MYEGSNFREHIHGALSTLFHTEHRDEQIVRRFLAKAIRPAGTRRAAKFSMGKLFSRSCCATLLAKSSACWAAISTQCFCDAVCDVTI